MPEDTSVEEENPIISLFTNLEEAFEEQKARTETKRKEETEVINLLLKVLEGEEDSRDELDNKLDELGVEKPKGLDDLPQPEEKNPLKRLWNKTTKPFREFWSKITKPFRKLKEKFEDVKRWIREHKGIIIASGVGIGLLIIAWVFLL